MNNGGVLEGELETAENEKAARGGRPASLSNRMRALAVRGGANRRERGVKMYNLVHYGEGLAVAVEPRARRTNGMRPVT